jgi:membrane protein DedA with SNARE-associated domain
VSLPTYALIASTRIATAFVVCHMIGRAYHDDAIGWFRKYMGLTPEAEDAFNRGFDRAEWLLIPFFAGSNIVAALSGVHRTPLHRLALLLAVGITARLVLMWWLARTFEDQLVDFLTLLQRYQWWAVGISIAVVLLVNARNFLRA